MSNGNGKKDLNFELDLLPFISMLSCCICFLMLTAVWTNIGALNVEQGLGQESSRANQSASSLWVIVDKDGSVELSVKDAPEMPASYNKINVFARSGRVDFAQIEKIAAQMNSRLPDLKTALVMPKAQVAYGDVITLMDSLKKHKISEVGIAPL
jgi:biopolymer transport protein TolR